MEINCQFKMFPSRTVEPLIKRNFANRLSCLMLKTILLEDENGFLRDYSYVRAL